MLSVVKRVLAKRALATAATIAIVGAFAGLSSSPAGATPFPNVQCHGTLNGTPLPDSLIGTQNLNFTVDAPVQANAGSQFTITIKGGSATLPSTNGPFTINNFTDLSSTISIAGGTFVTNSAHASGVATINGTPISPPGTVTFPDAHTMTSSSPGPIVPGTLVTPDITVKVNAGAAGSTVSVSAVGISTTAHLTVGAAVVNCPVPQPAVIATTSVVTPPPPGAPNANPDKATTDEGKAVTIDVLKNDTPNSAGPIDDSSLKVITAPKHGTAVVNTDNTITYTPDAGFSGADSFVYHICTQIPVVTTTTGPVDVAAVQPCASAAVAITVVASTPVTTAGSTAAATTTTVAPAELPRTGSTSMPLVFLGFGLFVSGLAAVGLAKSRRRSAAN
jgi:LPXTG-motif cell wall-anchored protein